MTHLHLTLQGLWTCTTGGVLRGAAEGQGWRKTWKALREFRFKQIPRVSICQMSTPTDCPVLRTRGTPKCNAIREFLGDDLALPTDVSGLHSCLCPPRLLRLWGIYPSAPSGLGVPICLCKWRSPSPRVEFRIK